MALLLDKNALGRAGGIVARDLSEKALALEKEQRSASGTFDLQQERLWIDEYTALAARGVAIEGLDIADGVMDTPRGPVRTRTYTSDAKGPMLLFVHGGGWVIGSIQSHDHIARWLASQMAGTVVQVEYSLAPENPFPAAITEITAVISSLLDTSDGRRPLFVGGDSAGANIASMSILSLHPEQKRGIAGFISLYGAYSPDMNFSSHRIYGDGRFGLSDSLMRWFWNLYAPQIPQEMRSKRLGPLGADLRDFPPTLCVGAECDLLLDDTLAFYAELAKASVDVSLSLWPSITHGAMHFVGVVDSVTKAAGSIIHFIESHRGSPQKIERVENHAPLPAGAIPVISMPPSAFSVTNKEELRALRSALVDISHLVGRSQFDGSVTHSIAGDIMRGSMEPGALLQNEDNASASLGVSRSAYREAIRTLAAKGLVTPQPKVGTRIAPRSNWHILDPDVLAWHLEFDASETFIRDLFELRKIVEPSSAALAALRRSDDELARLADALSRMARTDPRSGGWLSAVTLFHRDLLSASHNEAVSALWPAIQTTLQWSVQLQMSTPGISAEHDPVAGHARVFEKIASRDAEGALTEMALHIDEALADTMSNFRQIKTQLKLDR